MSVFENEGNVSQDANFRAHLDSNWDSGNREFDKVEGQLRIALADIQFLKTEIHNLRGDVNALNQRCDKIEEKHNDDIKALTDKHNDDIEATNQRLTKLEKAVFEAQYINDTKSDVEAKPSITHEINDTHVVNDDNGIIIQDEHQTLPNDVN